MTASGERRYTVVLTSCGRFDLLRRTAASFLKFADIAPEKFVVMEDSGDDGVHDALAGLQAPFDIVVNRPRLGQTESIDAGYARVETPFVFHCEDDWEFFRTGFVAESFVLLEALPTASTVLLRGRDEHLKLHKLKGEEINGVKFFRTHPKTHRLLWGYAYNPGLRRMADYRRIAPLAKIGDEGSVSFAFKCLGFATAHLEIPAVYHIGWGRHAHNPKTDKPENFLNRKFRRWREKIKLLKWRTFGPPTRPDLPDAQTPQTGETK